MNRSAREKFLFDTSFDGADGKLLFEQGSEPPPPQFSEEELAQARREGFAEGRDSAQAEAALLAEQRLADAGEKIALALQNLFDTQETVLQQLERDATEATALMLRKLFPYIAEKSGMQEVEALIGDCLARVREEPRIVVRTAPQELETLAARIDRLAAERAYEGKVVVISDDELSPGDSSVEWADGGAARDSARLLEEIDRAIGRASFLIGAEQTPTTDGQAAEPTNPVTEETSDG